MRKRSLSVAVERDIKLDHMYKKFEGVTSEHEEENDQSDSEEENDEIDADTGADWSEADYIKLVERLRAILPKNDVKKCDSRFNAIDWTTVAFGNHSPESTKLLTAQLVKKIRKYRILAEVIEEIPLIAKKLTAPGKPKHPPSAYNLFVKEKYASFKDKNQGIPSHEIFKKLGQEFAILSDKKKRKYEETAQQAKESYKAQLEQFYRDHPSAVPTKKSSTRKKSKSMKIKIITPYNLYAQEKRAEGNSSSHSELRKMWEELPVSGKLKYIRDAFKDQDSKPKKFTKTERILLDQAHGKPEPVPRTVAEYYLKHYADANTRLSLAEWRKQKIAEFKNLSKVRKLELEIDFRRAKQEFVTKYQEYITNLTDEGTRRNEIELLQSFISTKMDKEERKEYNSKSLRSLIDISTSNGADFGATPIAESTMNEVSKSKAKSKKSKETESDAEIRLENKNLTKPLKSILKSPSAVAVASTKRKPVEEAQVASSPKKKKRNESESDSGAGKHDAETKKSNKNSAQTAKKSQQNGKFDPSKEPTRPPKTTLEHFKQSYYLGKAGMHKEAYKNLPLHRRRTLRAELKEKQNQYYNDMQNFFRTVPKDKIEYYMNKLRRTGDDKNESSDDDDSSAASDSSAESDSSEMTKQEPETSSDDDDDDD